MSGLTAPIPNKKRLVLALDNQAALVSAKVAPTQLVRLKDSEKLYRIRTGSKVKSTDVELNSGNIAELIDHDHNGLYYTQAQVDQLINAVNQAISDNSAAIDTKAAGTHTHDGRYYTESEVDQKLADVVANGVQLSNSYTGNRTSVATTEKALSDGLATKANYAAAGAVGSILLGYTTFSDGGLLDFGVTIAAFYIKPASITKQTDGGMWLSTGNTLPVGGTYEHLGYINRFNNDGAISLFKRVA